jgi:hypothetical protein
MGDEALSKDFVLPIGKAKVEKQGKFLCPVLRTNGGFYQPTLSP